MLLWGDLKFIRGVVMMWDLRHDRHVSVDFTGVN